MIITDNGSFKLNNNVLGRGGSQTIIYASGLPAGASIALHYLDELNNLVAITDGILEFPEQYVLNSGSMTSLYAVVTGATVDTKVAIQLEGAG